MYCNTILLWAWSYLDFITVTFKATIKIFFILAIMIGV